MRTKNQQLRTPGICRIDQPSHRTHGFFARLQRRGKLHSAFFSDLKHGGKAAALAAAQEHQRKLAAKLGTPMQMARRAWAEVRRRKGSSSVVGVQRVVDRRRKPPQVVWKATWSPEPYVVRRRQFSVNKHGALKAKRLAIRARLTGLRQMEPLRRSGRGKKGKG